jgi:hypothetical protein
MEREKEMKIQKSNLFMGIIIGISLTLMLQAINRPEKTPIACEQIDPPAYELAPEED